VSEKSARSNCDRQRFPKWHGSTPSFVRRCNLAWETAHEDYTSSEVGLKKEIPDYVRPEAPIYFAP